MAVKLLDQLAQMQQPISNDLIPCEGPRAIPITLDFSLYDSYVFDYQNMQQRNFISMVQTIYVDNSLNSQKFSVTANISNQTINAKAGAQGYYAVLVPSPIKLTFSSPGGGTVKIALINTQMTTCVWNIAETIDVRISGTVDVADEILDDLVIGDRFNVRNGVTGSGDLDMPDLVPNYTKTTAAGITATAAALITGAPGYYIGGFTVQLSSAAAFATADLLVSIDDSSSGQIAVVVLNAAVRAASIGLLWNNKTNNSNLSLTLSTPLTAGKLYYTIPYGQASFVG